MSDCGLTEGIICEREQPQRGFTCPGGASARVYGLPAKGGQSSQDLAPALLHPQGCLSLLLQEHELA